MIAAIASRPLFALALTLVACSSANAIPIRYPLLNFGAVPERNMVNLRERNLPTDWSIEPGKLRNIKWSADVGTKTFGSPVVAHGRVFVATNNNKPRDPNTKKEMAVLMAFDERSGAFLWQNAHDCPRHEIYCPGDPHLLMSTPTVDGRKLYYVTPLCEVVCADCLDGKIHWRHDLLPKLKRVPLFRCACSPLVVGDLVYIVTGHGMNADYDNEIDPDAPSFVALNKHTGKIVWESKLPGRDIIHGQWSNPTFAVVDGVPQVIFGGGDCVLYGLAPDTGRLLWKCDCLPKRTKERGIAIDNTLAGTPVVIGKKLYVGLGYQHDGLHGQRSRFSYFLCLDISNPGDVSLKSYDPKAPENKGSALVWAYGGPTAPGLPQKQRPANFGATMSTAAIHDGLVYISEHNGYLHCLDANTGQPCWVHDVKSVIIGSPYWADGKVYLATDDAVWVYAHGRTAKVLGEIDMDSSMWTTPTAANGVLFVLTHKMLYAIR